MCVCVSLDVWCSIVLYTGSNISILAPKRLGPELYISEHLQKNWSISENFGTSCPYRVAEKTKPEFLKIQMQTNMYLNFTCVNTN